MSNILPIPSKDFFPKFFRDNLDADGQALADKIDELVTRWEKSNLALGDLESPERVPAKFLDELDFYLEAGFLQGDSEQIKRKKIDTAVQGHKRRGSFTQDAKPKIDAISGTDSALVTDDTNSGQWILFSDGILDATTKWGVMDGGISGDDFGLLFLSDGTECELAGVICIDLIVSTLTAQQIADIVEVLDLDIAPAYMRIVLGFFVGTVFTAYANGIIG